MKRIGTVALVMFAGVVATGCTSTAYKEAVLARAKAVRAAPDYVIGEGDTITITVLEQPEYTISGPVRSDGKIAFPRHGDVTAAGFTTEALRKQLEQDFKESLRLTDPKVYVTVTIFDSKTVTIIGEVERPGRFAYTGRMRITDLYGLAVGTTTRSKRNRALLFREVDGATKIYKVRLKDFFEEGKFDTNFYVQPGDILFVPRNNFAELGDVIRTVLDPVAALFDTISLGDSVVTTFAPVP